MVLRRLAAAVLIILAGAATPASAVEWTVGGDRFSGSMNAGSYLSDTPSSLGLHARCGFATRWNLGFTWRPSDSSVQHGPAVGSDGTEVDQAREYRSRHEWTVMSLGYRLDAADAWRWDLLGECGYAFQRDETMFDGRIDSDEMLESWTLALGVRPEVRLYRDLWVSGKLGVRWIETTLTRYDDQGWRIRRTTRTSRNVHAFGGFGEGSLSLVWSF